MSTGDRDRRAWRGTLLLGADSRTAMAAGIVQRADHALTVADDDDGVFADLEGKIGAGLGDLAVMADEEPVLVPDFFQIDLEEIGIGVEGLFEAVAGLAALEALEHVAADRHDVVIPRWPAEAARAGPGRDLFVLAWRKAEQWDGSGHGASAAPAAHRSRSFRFKAGFRAPEPSLRGDPDGAFPGHPLIAGIPVASCRSSCSATVAGAAPDF